MKALIWARSTIQKERMHGMLRRYGFRTILDTCSFTALQSMSHWESERVRLMVIDCDELGFDLQFLFQSPLLKARAHLLNIILIGSRPFENPLASNERRRNFVYLRKPFKESSFIESIEKSFERSSSRNFKLAFLGKIPPLFENSPDVSQISSCAEWILAKSHLDPMALVVNADGLDSLEAKRLKRFKMNAQGVAVPLLVTYQNSAAALPLRVFADYVIQSDKIQWDQMSLWLKNLTEQRTRISLLEARLKSENYSKQQRKKDLDFAIRAVLENPLRLALQEWLGQQAQKTGKLSEAKNHYLSILKWNPCLPQIYLKLSKVMPELSILQDAAIFCPRHPELQSKATLLNSDTLPIPGRKNAPYIGEVKSLKIGASK